MPIPDEHAIASFRKFYKHIPRTKDQSLVILKLHLLVEEQIRTYVDGRLPHKEKLAKISCHQAICLAEALSTENINPAIWEAARKLNSLRNKIAHHLEPENILSQAKNIALLFGIENAPSDPQNLSTEESILEDFAFAISMVHGAISLHAKPTTQSSQA